MCPRFLNYAIPKAPLRIRPIKVGVLSELVQGDRNRPATINGRDCLTWIPSPRDDGKEAGAARPNI